MTTNDSELQQRKIYEKIRLYTQYGINDPNNPSDDEKAKLKTHFETLLKQYTNDRKDHTSPTYSAFLEGESPSAPTATTDLINTRVDSNAIPESAVDLALPIVFFETGSISSKLENWSQFIGPKLKPKGADLWDHADDIDRSKKPTIFALQRVGESAKDFFKNYAVGKEPNINDLILPKVFEFLKIKKETFMERLITEDIETAAEIIWKNKDYNMYKRVGEFMNGVRVRGWKPEDKQTVNRLFKGLENIYEKFKFET